MKVDDSALIANPNVFWLCFLCTFGVFSVGCSRDLTRHKVAISPDLKAYTACEFSDGLQVVRVDPLAPGIRSRMVATEEGPKQVAMLSGARIMFAYPTTDFYANVKAEKLPPADYPQLKLTLVESLDSLSASSPSIKRNITVARSLAGFDAHGIDRDRLEGGVIGLISSLMIIGTWPYRSTSSTRMLHVADSRRLMSIGNIATVSCSPMPPAFPMAPKAGDSLPVIVVAYRSPAVRL